MAFQVNVYYRGGEVERLPAPSLSEARSLAAAARAGDVEAVTIWQMDVMPGYDQQVYAEERISRG